MWSCLRKRMKTPHRVLRVCIPKGMYTKWPAERLRDRLPINYSDDAHVLMGNYHNRNLHLLVFCHVSQHCPHSMGKQKKFSSLVMHLNWFFYTKNYNLLSLEHWKTEGLAGAMDISSVRETNNLIRMGWLCFDVLQPILSWEVFLGSYHLHINEVGPHCLPDPRQLWICTKLWDEAGPCTRKPVTFPR